MKMPSSDKLKSLPALVLQGFAAGAILFFAVEPLDRPAPEPASATGSVLDGLAA